MRLIINVWWYNIFVLIIFADADIDRARFVRYSSP